MIHEFLETNRAELVRRCARKAAKRIAPKPMPDGLQYGVPVFLEQLIQTFRAEQTPAALAQRNAVGPARPSLALVPAVIASDAAHHGVEMRQQGLTVDQVVHGYGDLCQALTELAMEEGVEISVDEFHTFNRCLDDAIADAVTSYTADAEKAQAAPGSDGVTSMLPAMQSLVGRAIRSFAAIKAGEVGLSGTTSTLHEHSLSALRELIERGLSDIPAAGGTQGGKTGAVK